MNGGDYNLTLEPLTGARTILDIVHEQCPFDRMLDVGCGEGAFTKAALDKGIKEILSIDYEHYAAAKRLFPKEHYRPVDLNKPWDLGKKYDLAVCLEVAEHLLPETAEVLIKTLTQHTDTVLFSAAVPHQPGDDHINCRWPTYWQAIFNQNGYECIDNLRPLIRNDESVRPWYRQNIFMAVRNEKTAGKEPRLDNYIIPEIQDLILRKQYYDTVDEERGKLVKGRVSFLTLFKIFFKGIGNRAWALFRVKVLKKR